MHMVVKLEGMQNRILEDAVHLGLAKTKIEALRMAILTLEHKYNIIERIEDQEDARDMELVEQEIREGKSHILTPEEFEQRTGMCFHPGSPHKQAVQRATVALSSARTKVMKRRATPKQKNAKRN